MTFEADLRAHLLADAGIAALVVERVYPLKRPNDTLPAITFTRVIGEPLTDLDGEDGNLMVIREQLDVWAASFTAARTLSELVRARVKTAAATFVGRTNFDQEFYEDDVKLYRVMLDCAFDYRLS